MHVTSVPSEYGIGDFGPAAYEFVDFLKKAGQNYWQILPINYTGSGTGYSPYNCCSAFAGNPLLISPGLLYRDGLLAREEVGYVPDVPADKVDYAKVGHHKGRLLDAAFARFTEQRRPDDYEPFLQEHAAWLEPFASFVAVKSHFQEHPWCDWPAALRDRKAHQLRSMTDRLKQAIERERFYQYIFYKQYLDLKRYCNEQGIQVIGDVPVYVAYDSADVWSHRRAFKLNKAGKPRMVAGVPPDYFSETGQLWGNPVYDWAYLETTGFDWWIQRIKHNLLLFDLVRIDHFRGLVAYWEVPASHKTAIRGKWVQTPQEKFFRTVFRHLPFAAIFAEDLGYITADVREVVSQYELPCMKVLQFAFDGDPVQNPHMPHNHIKNAVVYTGTHDNNTTRGWFDNELSDHHRSRVCDFLGREIVPTDISWELIRLAMASVANLAIIPMQDVLSLGAEARMNFPSTVENNWLWRTQPGQMDAGMADRLRALTGTYGRV